MLQKGSESTGGGKVVQKWSRSGVAGMRDGTRKLPQDPHAEGLDGHPEHFVGTAKNCSPEGQEDSDKNSTWVLVRHF